MKFLISINQTSSRWNWGVWLSGSQISGGYAETEDAANDKARRYAEWYAEFLPTDTAYNYDYEVSTSKQLNGE
jgi:hypothetical protein